MLEVHSIGPPPNSSNKTELSAVHPADRETDVAHQSRSLRPHSPVHRWQVLCRIPRPGGTERGLYPASRITCESRDLPSFGSSHANEPYCNKVHVYSK